MSASDSMVPMYLLLLPPTTWPAHRDSLRATYKAALRTVLKELSSSSSNKPAGARLDIGVVVPYLFKNRNAGRAALYEHAQALVAGIYKMICVIAAKENVNVENAEGLDARLFLLADPTVDANDQPNDETDETTNSMGPVIDLSVLARSERPYKCVFSIDNDIGNDILRRFTILLNQPVKYQKVKEGEQPDDFRPTQRSQDLTEAKVRRHTSIAVGGTWDHLHIGHKLLLTMFAFMLDVNVPSDKGLKKTMTIGITGDELLKNKKYAELVQSWKERQESVAAFLKGIMDFRPKSEVQSNQTEIWEEGPNGHVVIVSPTPDLDFRHTEISDPFGPTITDEAISALVLSAETRAGGQAVNDKRLEKGWKGLEVLEVEVLDAEEGDNEESPNDSFQSKLSSTSIRKALAEKSRVKI